LKQLVAVIRFNAGAHQRFALPSPNPCSCIQFP
jgi:hypothetical protein